MKRTAANFSPLSENCYDFLHLAKLREKREDVNPHFHLFSNLEFSISAKFILHSSKAYWTKSINLLRGEKLVAVFFKSNFVNRQRKNI